MSSSNGNITAPVNIQKDIAYTLGRGTGDVGQLCGDVDESGNRIYSTNPWSLIKPVRYGYMYHSSGWNASANNNYGIAAHSLGTGDLGLYNMRTFSYNGEMNGWVYEAPRGTGNGRTEYFRPLDFDGYKHSSPRPWEGWITTVPVVIGSQFNCGLDNVVSDWDYYQHEPITPDSIYFAHIRLDLNSETWKRLSGCYFGIAVFDEYNNCIHIATCGMAMGATASVPGNPDERWSVELTDIRWPAKDYRVIPFFWISDTTAPMPSDWLTNPEHRYGVFYTIPYTMPKTISVISDSHGKLTGTCGIDPAEQGDSPNEIRIGYSIQLNVSYATLVLSRFYLYLEDPNNNVTDIYDSDDDPNYQAPTVTSQSGTTSVELITSYDGLDIGIVPNCPVQKVMPKLSSGNYTLYAEAYIGSSLQPLTWHMEVTG